MKTDAYTDSYTIIYNEGDESLERRPITHREDIEDRVYTIKEEDTLTLIAFKFYNESLLWFIIADANNIINPLDITPGKNIIIPNLNRYEI